LRRNPDFCSSALAFRNKMEFLKKMFGNQLVISIFATPKQWRIYPESFGDCSFFNFF
jgi:hypothetical protein